MHNNTGTLRGLGCAALLAAALLAGCAGADEGATPPANNSAANNNPANNNPANNNSPECTLDSECPGTQICDDGACVEGLCTRDSECDGEQICLEDRGVCVTPECNTNADCGAGQYCEPDDKKCRDGCATTADCGANQICNTNTRSCEDTGGCTTNADCEALELCREAKCVAVQCVNDDDCDAAERCDANNRCQLREGFCAADGDCAQDQKCDTQTNQCVDVGCGECPEGTFCNEQAGECWECARDIDCGENRICNRTDHVCEDAGCTSNDDCPDGQLCNRISGACEQPEVCQADSFEPNNAQDNARMIGAGEFTDLSICEGDEDWFAIDLNAGDRVELYLSFTNVDGNLDLELFDPNGRRLGVGSSNADNEQIIAGDLALAGTYRIRVFGVDGASNRYGLRVAVVANPNVTCAADGFEPNNTAATAAAVIPQTFQSLVLCPGDDDWYKVRLNTGDSLQASIAFTHSAEGDLDLVVLRPDGVTILAESRSATDNEQVQTSPVDTTGDYYVRVVGASPAVTNAYALTLERTPAQVTCQDDSFEQNDTAAEASNINPGPVGAAKLCPGDEDWYAISLNAGDDLNVTLSFTHSAGDLDLALYRPDDLQTPLADSRTRTDNEVASFNGAPVAGLYLVRVFGANNTATNDYNLLVERAQPPSECVDDAREDNDNASQARPINEGSLANTICSGDEDWFSIHVNAGGALLAEIAFDGAQGDLNLEVVGPSGQVLGSSASPTASSESVEIDPAPRSGAYRIRVFSPRGDELNYTLETVTTDSSCGDDAFEENDARANAADLQPGTQSDLTICSNDDDWYAIDLAAGDGLTATIFFDDAAGDLDLQLVDAQGRILASSVSVLDNEEATVGMVETAGTYYVRVYGFLGAANTYDLDLDVIGGGTTCTDDAQEPNDSSNRARLITAGTRQDLIACPDDDDWYAVALQPGQILEVLLDFSHADGDIDLQAFDPNGARIDESTSVTDRERIAFRATTAGTYTFRVFGFLGDSNTYDMTVNVLSADACLEDDFEDNNTGEDAAFISPFQDLYLGLGFCQAAGTPQEDWYAVDLLPGENIDVFIFFSHDVGDLDLELYYDGTAAEDRIDRSLSINDAENVFDIDSLGGTYYIRVFSFDDAAISSEYDLVLDVF